MIFQLISPEFGTPSTAIFRMRGLSGISGGFINNNSCSAISFVINLV
jgi:hypothetical protein